MVGSNQSGESKLTESQRKGVQSAVAAAAYRSGQRLRDERTNSLHDYSRKRGVIHREIFAPPQAPTWSKNRQALWSRAELAEPRKNSTVAREFECALPTILTEQERLEVARRFCEELVDRHKFALDLSIHEPAIVVQHGDADRRNFHAHILTTTRRLVGDEFTEKCRELDDVKVGEVRYWRKRWELLVNEALERAGHAEQKVDCRSHSERGLDDIPTVKIGRHPGSSDRKKYNAEIRKLNREINNLQQERAIAQAHKRGQENQRLARIRQLKADLVDRKKYINSLSDAALQAVIGSTEPIGDRHVSERSPSTPSMHSHPNSEPQLSLAFSLKGNYSMDSIALRKILESAIDAAKLPQDLALILQRQRVDTHFVRSDDLRDIEALNLKDLDRKEWMTTDALGPDLSWPLIARKKNWQPILVTGLLSGSSVTSQEILRAPNVIEVELDLLAEQIALLVEWLRLLIIKIINLVLRHVEKAFTTTLPRMKATPRGVIGSYAQIDDYKPPSRDCLSQTSYQLRTLRDGIQARDPDRITLPIAVPGMPELHQGLRDLKIQESKTPAQRQAETEEANLAEWNSARKHLAATKRERWDVISLINGYTKGRVRPAPADGHKLLAQADEKLAKAECKLELAQSKFPMMLHDQDADAQNHEIDRPRG
jgi:hypothetical protein